MRNILLANILIAAGLTGCAPAATTASTDSEVAMSQMEAMAGQAAAEAEPDTTAIDYSRMFADAGNTAQYTLAELTAMDPNLSTFSTLLDQAELTDGLKTGKPLTLLAPTNQAFTNWPQDSLNNLMKPENKARLIKVLQAHMLTSEVLSASFKNTQRIETGGGEFITVSASDSTGIILGGATVVRADVKASNGVMHVVDRLVKPMDSTLPPR
ncbi:fasciclin domain-containing protein [Pontibacter flavimaris]|uniref:FAS1 domain-containing protein n=1 Tax=Pontibacter flavimaris TaxID=1797110 RepID=A0A1Q5PI56_9BACT|nr:fasciclin domain-containing protein [Pontibacter flavimaris]OKL41886.1 hypothetical protein A3841_07670 [Pontibacter flavimaris]